MQFISKFFLAGAVLFSGLVYADGQRIGLLIDAGSENSTPASFDEVGIKQDLMGPHLDDTRVVDKVLVVRVDRAEDLASKLQALDLQKDDKIARLYLTGPGQLPKPKLKENEKVASKWVRNANVGSLWFQLLPKDDAAAYRAPESTSVTSESDGNNAEATDEKPAAGYDVFINQFSSYSFKGEGPTVAVDPTRPQFQFTLTELDSKWKYNKGNDQVFEGLKAIRGIFTDDAAIYIDSAGFFPSWKSDHTTLVFKLKRLLGFADRPSGSELRSRGAEAYADALQAYFGLTNGSIFGFRGRTQRQPSLDALRVPFWRKDLRLSQRNRFLTQATVVAGMLASLYLAIRGETLEAALVPAALIYGWSFVTSGFNRGFEYRYAAGKATRIKSPRRGKMDKAFFKQSLCGRFLKSTIF